MSDKVMPYRNGVAPKFPCPKCGEFGSLCELGETTLVGGIPFMDAAGKAHFHNRNCCSVYARCSTGHYGYNCAGYFWCECGWRSDENGCECKLSTMKAETYPKEDS